MDENLSTPIPGVTCITYQDAKEIAVFVQVWTRATFWIRSYFNSLLTNSEDLEAVTNELFTIPMDYYNAFKPHFSEEIARRVYSIVYGMIYSNYQLINAYKNNDVDQINAITQQWYSGATRESAFYESVNPYWDSSVIYGYLFEYGKLKIQEIMAFYEGNYEEELSIYHQLEKLSVEIGDYMGRGIIARNAALRKEAEGETPGRTPG